MGKNSARVDAGSVIGSVVSVGDHNTNSVRNGSAPAPDPVEVARLVRESTDRLIAAAGTDDERAEVRDELGRVSCGLETGTVPPARIRSRWEIVKDILGPAAALTTGIATTVEKISAALSALPG